MPTVHLSLTVLQGIRDHKFVPFLSTPGKIDLSADVDFSSLRRTIQRFPDASRSRARPSIHTASYAHTDFVSDKLKVSSTITQGDFLQMMGIVPRLEVSPTPSLFASSQRLTSAVVLASH